MTTKKVGVGCPECGGTCGQPGVGASGNWRDVPIEQLARTCPQIALARLSGCQFIPLVLSCQATFSDPTTLTIPNVAWQGGSNGASLDRATVIESVQFEIDAQNTFPGAQLQNLNAFFYEQQSGITARINVLGSPKYTVSPFYQPLKLLVAMFNEGWPGGWFLNFTQGISMDFSASLPLPSFPTIVTVAWKMWQPLDVDFVHMSNNDAWAGLSGFGLTRPQ